MIDYKELDQKSKIINEYLRVQEEKARRENQAKGLKPVTLNQIYDCVFAQRQPIIEDFLYQGVYIFAGAPKLGKSFFMAQLAYLISTGQDLWNFKTNKGTVLYLALEDNYQRIQNRLYRMFGAEGTDQLFFSVTARGIGDGLLFDLKEFVNSHKDTKLIIIDTLQKVREQETETYSYAKDYDIIAELKAFADEANISIILVHHTRKQSSDDKFDMISGTNGLMGAADGAFILHKDKRTSKTATLEISGRDICDKKLTLLRNPQTLSWELTKTEGESYKKLDDPILEKINNLIPNKGDQWLGTASDLVLALGLEDVKPNALTRKLNVFSEELMNTYGIGYGSYRNKETRGITLRKVKTVINKPKSSQLTDDNKKEPMTI